MTAALRLCLGLALLLFAAASVPVRASNLLILGPSGSQAFGTRITMLPNGNFVVTDPMWNLDGTHTAVGAVYLYRADATLISTLRGSTTNDQIGSEGVTVLTNGNYVIKSSHYRNGAATDAGAVTFGNANTGVAGTVSSGNSLVGSSTNDLVGSEFSVTALSNGNYVVGAPGWSRPGAASVGAATWGSGTTGVTGAVSSSNSLVGGTAGDQVGSLVVPLTNGNYVVVTERWDNAAVVDVGAVTFCSGSTGRSGVVAGGNSLIGSTTRDGLGMSALALKNGGYTVSVPNFTTGIGGSAGAVLVAPAGSGLTGTISTANALIGPHAGDKIGNVYELANGNLMVVSAETGDGVNLRVGSATFMPAGGITGFVTPGNSMFGVSANDAFGSRVAQLSNGNIVVASPFFSNAGKANAGAVTLMSGTSPTVGLVGSGNSLVGGSANDFVGSYLLALPNGNLVTATCGWDNPGITANVGAVTWVSGTTGLTGLVSAANSLVGDQNGDQIGCITSGFTGTGLRALSNGNYVVLSNAWHGSFGAATFGNGNSGTTGTVSAGNSWVSSIVGPSFSLMDVTPLANGNYVVQYPGYNNGRGAVAFGSGTTGLAGTISTSNALIGGAGDSALGRYVVTAGGDSFVLSNSSFDNGAVSDVGSVTLASTTTGFSGPPTSSNSLVGSTDSDLISGIGNVVPQSNGNYVVISPAYDRNGIANVGAATLLLGDGSNATGPLSTANSVFGNATSDVGGVAYDPVRNQMPVGLSVTNFVVVFRPGAGTATSIVSQNPNPSTDGVPVSFTANVSATTAPSGGRVVFTAASGETCTATTATPVSANVVSFSCSLLFTGNGNTTVHAEYIGSNTHAYSRSADVSHASTVDAVFKDSFE